MTIGDFIRDYRRLHGISMDEFANLSGLSKSYISMLEKNMGPRGKAISPSLPTIAKIADVIQVDFDEIIRAIDQDVFVDYRPITPRPADLNAGKPDYMIKDKNKELDFLIEDDSKKWDFIKYCFEHATLEDRNRVLSILKVTNKWKEYKEMSDIFHKEP